MGKVGVGLGRSWGGGGRGEEEVVSWLGKRVLGEG